MNKDIGALPAGLPMCSGCVRVNHKEVKHTGGLSWHLTSCCGQEHTGVVVELKELLEVLVCEGHYFLTERFVFFFFPPSLFPCCSLLCAPMAKSTVVCLPGAGGMTHCMWSCCLLPNPAGDAETLLISFHFLRGSKPMFF